MVTGLIGHTGFVGSNLARQNAFDYYFNSSSINELAGKSFDALVCAAPSAVKWKANQDPEGDWRMVSGLINALTTCTAKVFIQISTVDVYPRPVGVDEGTLINPTENHAYGRHRFFLEEFGRQHFPQTLVVRLPGLFGAGLKKNVIFDLLHHNQIVAINEQSTYQYYNLDHLWSDIQTALNHNLQTINIATEPIITKQLAEQCFGITLDNHSVLAPVQYDMRSKHADLFGGSNGYLYGRDIVLGEISRFVTNSRSI